MKNNALKIFLLFILATSLNGCGGGSSSKPEVMVADLDGDGIADDIDPDIDGDNVNNDDDAFPLDSSETSDLDDDGVGDNSDPDIDGDGADNEDDMDPLDPNFIAHKLNSITFSDSNLTDCLALTYPGDTLINEIKVVDCPNKNINSLDGIDELVFIENLMIYNNGLNDLTPISSLNKLTLLYIGNAEFGGVKSNITDLTPLSNLHALIELRFTYSDVTSITALKNLTKLQILFLNKNKISDISPLSDLQQLQQLFINENVIADLTPLSNLANLNVLEFSQNLVNDLTPLSGLTSLVNLNVKENNITDVSTILNWPKLPTKLNLEGNIIACADDQALIDKANTQGTTYIAATFTCT
ncbi:leucine-rich repeat domain-containing protein [Thalassomonas sp. M1454]|uniref:leucine-rich repeat domain-containing protein n=1 Tax=Thalassomonas sp. M1454 TaxID=2594477 RepID=UPI00163DC0B6|nr:leucine-rich repeat domain-containing protein [Thalassomonas sp. M1454]